MNTLSILYLPVPTGAVRLVELHESCVTHTKHFGKTGVCDTVGERKRSLQGREQTAVTLSREVVEVNR